MVQETNPSASTHVQCLLLCFDHSILGVLAHVVEHVRFVHLDVPTAGHELDRAGTFLRDQIDAARESIINFRS